MKKHTIMRKLLLIFGLGIVPLLGINAQNWPWADMFSASGDVQTVDIQVSPDFEVYVAGTWKDGGNLTIGAQVLSSYGGQDAFLAKLDQDGNLIWIVGIGGTGDDEVSGIRIHPGNGHEVYLVGAFKSSSITVESTDPAGNVALTNAAANKWDTYVTKYLPDGRVVWSKRLFWGSDNDRLQDIDFKGNQMVIIGNFKSNPLNYDDGGGGGTLARGGAKDLFIARYDTSGAFQVIKKYIPTVQQSAFRKVLPCIYGGYYVTGDLLGDLQDGVGSLLKSTTSGDATFSDVFAMLVDDNLDFLWGRTGGGAGYDHVNYSTVSKYGNLYISGKTESSPSLFDSLETEQSAPLPALGGTDFYIAKYSSAGTLQWVRRKGTASEDNAYGLAIFQELVQFAGIFGAPLVINQDTLDCSIPGDVNTGFAILDRAGNEVGGEAICGDGRDEGLGVAYDPDGNTYVIGMSNSSTLQAGDIDLNNPVPGTYMGFLAHYEYAFSVSLSKVRNITCNGGSDGTITVTPHFGVYPFTYEWSHDALLNDSTATGLSAGDYTVTVTDARDSTKIQMVSLTEPTAINIAGVETEILCNGDHNGAIDITVTGGVPPYIYAWTGPGVSTSTEDQSGLGAGSYSVTVTDASGCIAVENYNLTEPDALTFQGTTKTDILIPPGCNGEIDLQVNGGTPAYGYSWTGPSGFSSGDEDLTGLCNAGNYSVQVTDNNSCTADTTIVLNDGLLFFAYICDETDVSCHGGNDGYAKVCTENATGNLSYEWNTVPGGIQVSTTDELTGASAGTYSVTVTDDSSPAGSPSTVQVIIGEPASLPVIANFNVTNITCNDVDDGEISIMVNGGTPPYTYSWVGPGGFSSSSKDIAGLSPGNYSVTITDANGCTDDENNIPVTEPPVITCNLVSTTNILCNGEQTGELCVTVSGGTGTLSVLWDDPAAQTTLCARFLDAGSYRVTVFDENGCSKTFGPFTVNQPPAIAYSSLTDNADCYGDCDGSIIMTVSGGTPSFSYAWYDATNNLVGTSKDLINACAGNYRLDITDANNCSEVFVGEITQPVQLEILSEDYTDPLCEGACDGTISIVATGGTPPYEYSVNNGTNWQSSGDFTGLCEGNYQVLVKDNNDCGVTGSLIGLSDPTGIVITGETKTDVSCFGSADGAISITATGREPLEYSIDGGVSWQTGGDFTGLVSGSYTIYIKDTEGCEKEGSTLFVAEPAELSMTPMVPLVDGNSISVAATGGTEPYIYILRNPEDSVTYNNTGTFSNLAAGTYVIEVNDANGCGPVQSGEAEVFGELVIFDAITPNGDQSNDTWVIYGTSNFPDMVVKIYNSWGTLVYESETGYPSPWEGKTNGRELPAGTYYYIIDLDGDGSNIMKGTVNIIK